MCPPWWCAAFGLNTYTNTHTWLASFLASSFVCICCAFRLQHSHSSFCWYVPSSSSLHWAERQLQFLSKPHTLLYVQICLQCCCNSSQAVSLTLVAIHTQAHKIQIACTESNKNNNKSIYCYLQWAPSCVELRLTPVYKNMKHFGTSGGEERWNPLRSPAFGLYSCKNSPILHFYQKQPKQARIYNWM